VEPWTPESVGRTIRTAGREISARGRELFHPLRLAVMGLESGPELAGVLAGLGRAETLSRIREVRRESQV
jgi:glutamyl-tRNA synthetase